MENMLIHAMSVVALVFVIITVIAVPVWQTKKLGLIKNKNKNCWEIKPDSVAPTSLPMQENVLIMEIATKKMIAIALTIVVSTLIAATIRITLASIHHITKVNALTTITARVSMVTDQMALAIA